MNKRQFEEITQWQRETFPAATSLSKIHHLKQELVELTTELLALNTDNKRAKRLEFADCFILLLGAAASDGMSYFDILNAVEEKMMINRLRTWGQPDEDGVVNHIKS